MIKHHPNLAFLGKFAEGELPASIAAAIAIHVEMCPKCQQQVKELTQSQAERQFEQLDAVMDVPMAPTDIDAMIEQITASDEIDLAPVQREKIIAVKGTQYKLPQALTNMAMSKWTSIGKLARARFELDEGEVRASLLQIQAGGAVPEHTHKGFEITLLLDGSFKDEMGEYVPGDFMLLDGKHLHSPATDTGCLCYTVSNDAQHFTQGINKLLNPIGSFIY
ncbi:ChrR family anti-sigma-E factor [Colwellia sp. MEBiC06753]